VKLEDAPQPGWYPDPQSSGLLRWWEGTDWSDQHRALPTATELLMAAGTAIETPEKPALPPKRPGDVFPPAPDSEQIVNQVRAAARAEVDRAAELFTRQTRSAISQGRSLVAEYIDRVLRWIKIAVVAAAIAVIIWFILQLFLQATVLDWIGDRVDNLSD